MLLRRLIFFLLLFALTQAKAQNTIALPDIVNYSKQTYDAGAANWGIIQDKNGIIYVANDECLLTFDGNFWKRYYTSSSEIIRSIALAPDGKIYVGTSGEIGFFKPDENGLLQFTSLNKMIPENEKDFTEIWNIVVLGDAVYFRSFKRIFELRNNKITVYNGLSWSYLGSANSRLICKAYGKGLMSFQNNQWKPFLKGDTLEEQAQIVSLLPINGDSILLLTKKHGAYILRGDLLLPLQAGDIQSICEKNPYSVSYIDHDRIAIGTSLGGCFIVNRNWQIIQRLTKQDGLQSNDIISVFVDREKNLWLGLNNGIDFVAYNNAIRHIFPDYQEHSGGKAAIVYNNDLYIGSSNGLYYAPIGQHSDIGYVKTSFKSVPDTKGQVWSLTEINGQLLMGHNDGFSVLKNHALQVIDGSTGVWSFLPLGNIMPSPVILAGTYNGVNFYDYQKGVFINPSINAHFESVRFMAIANNIAWVCHPSKGLFKVQLNNGIHPTYSVYKDTKGILSKTRNHIFKLKSRVILTSDNGFFEYDEKADDFIPCTYLKNIFGDTRVTYLQEDNDGNIWFVENKRLGVVDFSKKETQIIHFPELNNKIMTGGFEYVYAYNRNNIFVAAEDGFYLINYEQYKTGKEAIPILINSVKISNKKDSVIFGGYAADVASGNTINQIAPEIKYRWNSIHFEYSSALYGKQSSIEYSYYLDGFDKGWSAWSGKPEKDYFYLSPGSYTFKVKARTHEGDESQVLTYRFTILPPWYRSSWMYLVYTVLLIFIIYGIHLWQRKKFMRQQQKHEEERNKLEFVNKLQKEKFEEEQKQLTYLHQLEIERHENEIIRLRNENLETEINLKNSELASTTLNLIQKGEMLVKVKEEFVKMKKVNEVEKESGDYKKILKMLGDDKMKRNWEQFSVHFDKVHSDFLVSMKAAFPNLTPSELKLCAYLRLSLSSKEIAQIMNITIKSVELARHRLRKKLGIPPEVNLFNFLLNFHSELDTNKNGH